MLQVIFDQQRGSYRPLLPYPRESRGSEIGNKYRALPTFASRAICRNPHPRRRQPPLALAATSLSIGGYLLLSLALAATFPCLSREPASTFLPILGGDLLLSLAVFFASISKGSGDGNHLKLESGVNQDKVIAAKPNDACVPMFYGKPITISKPGGDFNQSRMVRSLKNLKKIKRKIKVSKKRDSSYFSKVPYVPAKVWEPLVDELEEGEELQFDPSTYNCYQRFSIERSCLSFDIIHDSLGLVRSEFPHTLFGIAGTQAKKASLNYIGIFKISNISGKRRDLLPSATDDEDIDMDSESGSDEDDVDSEPILQLRKIRHQGCVNRIRAMSQKPHICATWAERGHVQVWDFTSQLNTLMESEAQSSHGGNTINGVAPLFRFDGHKDEGFAMDWNPAVPGRLISGDRNSSIHLWEPSSDSWIVDRNPFVGHKASVEDLQWSPTQENLFASCSVDGNISLWDTRLGKSPAASLKAHNTDVNAISWNRLESFMIVSGSDDGAFSIWDLRLIKEDSRVAHFEYHKKPITSIEWCPHEASTLAVSSADNQLTIWDLSLERDEEGEAEFKAKYKQQATAPQDSPPQFLFAHHGQKDLKELHWHRQIPGMIVSGDIDGLDVLMPSNIASFLTPPASKGFFSS